MENVHLESWEFGRGWTLDHFTLEMVEPRYFPMIGYPEAWTTVNARRNRRGAGIYRRQNR